MVIVPCASTPSKRPPPGGTVVLPNRNTTTDPFVPAAPTCMCDRMTLVMLAEISRYSSWVPSGLSWNFTSPTAGVSRAGTSDAPVRWATKFSGAGTSGRAPCVATSAVGRLCSVGTPGSQLAAAAAAAAAPPHAPPLSLSGRGGQDRELTPAEAGRGVHGAAGDVQYLRHPAQGAAADEVPVAVIDPLQAVHVEEEHRERPLGALRPPDLGLEDRNQLPVVGEPGQRVGHRLQPQPPGRPTPLRENRRQNQCRDGSDAYE